MLKLNLFAILYILNSLLTVQSDINRSAGSSTASCPQIKLLHGRVKYRNKMTQAKFVCNRSYILAGERFAVCRKGAWDHGRPVCVKTTCSKVNPPHNAIMYPAYNGGVLNFYCKPGFEIRGASSSYCDGLRWNTSLPSCLLTNTLPALSCDFESADLCGWSQDMNHNFDWKRDNFETTRGHINTGPKYDHDNNTGGFGYYMYIESASRRENDTARLISPIYNRNENGLCFTFFYHMYGVGIGQLRVYVKKISDSYDLLELNPQFTRSGNQGDIWRKGMFFIEEIDEDFQIIIEGVRGSHIESDIAIDDVKISDYCDDVIVSSTTVDYTSEHIPTHDSCLNRCGQITEFLFFISCDCTDDCIENNICCPDYSAYCILGSATDFIEYTTEEPSTPIDATDSPTTHIKSTVKPTDPPTTSIKFTVDSILVTPVSTISPKMTTKIIKVESTTKPTLNQTTPIVIPPMIPRILPKSINITPKIIGPINKVVSVKTTQKIRISITTQTTSKPTTTPTTTQKPIKTSVKNKIPIFPTKPNIKSNSKKTPVFLTTTNPWWHGPRVRVKTTTEQIEDTTDAVQTPQIETDYTQNDTQTMDPFAQMSLRHSESKHDEAHWSVYFIIEIVVGSVCFMLLTVIGVVLKRKFGLGCPGFKQQRYSESMSDVRFLAGEEALDFTWKQPDN